MPKVFLNDRIVDQADATVSTADSGFLYGIGLFETMRFVEGEVFAIDDHLRRLFASCQALEIENPFTSDFIKEAIAQTVKANDLSDARIRLTMSGGQLADEKPTPTLLITAVEFTGYPKEYYEKGVAVVLTDYRQNPNDPLTGHKATSYFSRLAALKNARSKGAVEALWFTPNGQLAEGCVSNVFIVKDSKLYTPSLDTPVLPGIARKHVLSIASQQNIETIEKDLTIKDVLEADEVFVSNVVMLILPVIVVEAHAVADGKPGPITKNLLNAFRELVEK